MEIEHNVESLKMYPSPSTNYPNQVASGRSNNLTQAFTGIISIHTFTGTASWPSNKAGLMQWDVGDEGHCSKFLFRLYVLYLRQFCKLSYCNYWQQSAPLSLRYRPETGEIPLWVGSETLPQVKEFKYLGVLFASNGRMEGEMDWGLVHTNKDFALVGHEIV